MYLKYRYRLGYETLCKEVADSLGPPPMRSPRPSSTGSSPSGSRCRPAVSRTSSSGDDTLRDNDTRRREETR